MNLNIPNIDLPRVVIVGCGFAGLKLIKKISNKSYQTVLLDKNNYHTFQPLMYQVASSSLEPDSIVHPIRKVFKGKKNFHFRLTEVNGVNLESKELHTNIGSLKYDILVVATGATTNFVGMKDIRKYGYTMKSLIESLDLRSIILQNFERALITSNLKERDQYMNFVIVGGGATGIELAGALAELKNNILPNDYPDLDIRQMQIHVIEAADRVLPGMSDTASRRAFQFLQKLGVNVWPKTTVSGYDGNIAVTSANNFYTKTLIWSAGVIGSPIGNLNNKLNKNNRIITDQLNKVKGQNSLFAIGDVACIEAVKGGKGHVMLASVAGQQGHQLGKNLNAIAKNKSMTPFRYKDRGTMATIGRNRAVVDLPFLKFSGIIAWFVWMFLHLMLLVDYRNRIVVFFNWSWSYLKYEKGLRLIIRKVQRPKDEN